MTAGRKPLPIETLKLRGSYRADRHRTDTPLDADAAQMPDDLPAGAAAVWEQLAPPLIANGLLTSVDVPAFTVLCTEYARWRELDALVRTTGGNIIVIAGRPQANPALREMQRSRDAVLALLSQFGMTPSARRSSLPRVPAKPADPKGAARFFAEGTA